ncbi:MAG: E3 ubiquitin ligase family protein [Myxococcales bacterium]|nr:E3 ubiquitin ligase family protein [Myxococcales bacterium]
MNIGLLLIGIVALLVGGGCLWAFGNRRDKVFQMKLAETRKVSEIRAISSEVAGEIGAGSFNEVLEVKGVLKCAEPLKSALKGEPCVHYEMEVVREYEERVERVDQQTGRHVMETVRRSETLSSNSQSVEFTVDDGSGEIVIRPDGAEIDSVQILDQFQPGDAHRGSSAMIRFGDFSLSVGPVGSNRHTLGYRYRERILPLGRRVYVLGEARDDDGMLAIRRPTSSEKRFIISLKSEEELIRSNEESMNLLKYGGYGGLGAGLLLLILSFIT